MRHQPTRQLGVHKVDPFVTKFTLRVHYNRSSASRAQLAGRDCAIVYRHHDPGSL